MVMVVGCERGGEGGGTTSVPHRNCTETSHCGCCLHALDLWRAEATTVDR